MSTTEGESKAPASALAARELESAVNSKKLLDEHVARTGGKVRLRNIVAFVGTGVFVNGRRGGRVRLDCRATYGGVLCSLLQCSVGYAHVPLLRCAMHARYSTEQHVDR